jgi:UTP--glucose-1-phosphate uridylyltransferase
MKISKAVITSASPLQRKLPLQTLIDSDGIEKSVLSLLIQEVKSAGINDIAIIVCPGDEIVYNELIADNEVTVQFIVQEKPEGYAKALLCAKSFINNEPFLHLVGDHIYIDQLTNSCAKHIVDIAEKYECSVSSVQATREHLIPNFGVIGGLRFQNSSSLYEINRVIEKPTPTEAEQHLFVSGLRTGYYLCFFGMHVLTPSFIKFLEGNVLASENNSISISSTLNELAQKEQYLAVEKKDLRIDLGSKYGLLKAQLALAANGNDRNYVLSELLELFINKESLKK